MCKLTAVPVWSSRVLTESNDGVVPWINCPPMHDKDLASQSGLTPFGATRSHAMKVQNRDGECKKDINKIVDDHASEGILKIWSRANPEAKIDQPFGKHRDTVVQIKGGRPFSERELNASNAMIPRFHDPRETIAAKALRASQHRTNPKLSNSGDMIVTADGKNELDPNRYLAWLGGQLTLQSEIPTGGSLRKPHKLASSSYFDRVMSERDWLVTKKNAAGDKSSIQPKPDMTAAAADSTNKKSPSSNDIFSE